MSQPKAEIEKHYENEDPWQYKKTEDDQIRKRNVVEAATAFGRFQRCLDIGAGEGWITADLPARQIDGIEISDNAAKRFPKNVRRVHEPDGTYDLVVCTGVLYGHYDLATLLGWIRASATGILITSHIKAWEHPEVAKLGKTIFTRTWPYRQRDIPGGEQLLRVIRMGG